MAETQTSTAATPNAIAQIVAAILAKLEKTGKAIWKPTDNQSVVSHVAEQLAKSPNFADWSGKAPEAWKGVAIVNTKGKKGETIAVQTRAIAFPDIDTVLNDPGMRNVLYDRYIGMLCRAAGDPEAEEAAFSTIGGPWAEEDKGAYNFQAQAWVTLLIRLSDDPKGMEKALNTRTLRQALESAEYAKSRFPGMEGKWAKLLDMMVVKAQQGGFSTAIFEHWIATRDVVADAKKISVNFDENTEALLASLGPTKQAA